MFRFLVWWRKFHFYRIILDWKNTLEKRFKKKIPAVVFFWCQETCLFFNPQSKGEFNHSFISPSIWTSAVFWVVSISSPIRELRISGSPHGHSPHIWHHTFDIYTSLVRLCSTVIKKLPNICKSVDIFHMFYKRVPLRECILWCASCLLISASS